MPFFRKIYYLLNRNYYDILSFKNDLQYKLYWSDEKYEKIKQQSFDLTEVSYELIDNFNKDKFELFVDAVENLYLFINDEINITFDNSSNLNEEIIYRYLIRLNNVITDINYLKKIND